MTPTQSQQFTTAVSAYLAIIGIISLISIVIALIIWWRIFSKAGYSGAMSILMLVPIANLVAICILAFGEWPIQRELNMLRQQVRSMPQYPPVNPQGPQYPPVNPQGPQFNPQAPGQNFQSGPQYPRY
ncbi:hypothetical protein [Dictyobacter kobayashii]|uniref:Uncharacterized protein n=1 Tax=Dictyobacter kobayashii TaxID=2014872 RepID=A0A402AJ91_9CHLR|nr:hypothetical protein [Dictyobacter kobayashii]GCE19187.1 hypothetical protein KDK_29870 [Dictyobacter kobayashii]